MKRYFFLLSTILLLVGCSSEKKEETKKQEFSFETADSISGLKPVPEEERNLKFEDEEAKGPGAGKIVREESANDKIVNNSPYPIAPGSHKFDGNADGNLPIVVKLDVSSRGDVSGKMAYKSILKKYGDKEKNYMFFSGHFSGYNLILSVSDEKGNNQDWDLKVSDDGTRYKLSGSAYSYTKDKTFSISVSGK